MPTSDGQDILKYYAKLLSLFYFYIKNRLLALLEEAGRGNYGEEQRLLSTSPCFPCIKFSHLDFRV